MDTLAAPPIPQPPLPTRPARIGAVRYLNTIPLIGGLGRLADVELRLGAPAELFGMIQRDEVDLALASIVDAVRADPEVALVPVGMIGCEGRTLTVRLISRTPIDRLTTIHGDTDSHTSIILAQLTVARLSGGAPPSVRPWDASAPGPWPDAAVVIGDKVMDPRAADYPYSIDLGESWKDATGLPFVYAMWMCRADRAGSPEVRFARAVLDRQRRRNEMRLDTLATGHAATHGWTPTGAREYLGSLLRYTVTDAHRAGAERFLADAGALGLIAGTPRIRWADA